MQCVCGDCLKYIITKWNVYIPSELGDSRAVGRGRAGCGGSERVIREVSICVHVNYR
jgi:hypothetical protein